MPTYNTKFGQPVGYIEERVTRSQFTDGGSTAGTYQLKETIPAKAQVLQTLVTDVVGFTGDTSAVMTVGDGSDVDRYNTSTINVFASAVQIAAGAVSGTAVHTTAVRPTLTVTSAADFTNVTAGALTIRIVYLAGA